MKGAADNRLGGAVGALVSGALVGRDGDTAPRAWVRWIG